MSQFPGAIPPPRQNPFPQEPMYGNMASDVGQGLRQTGDDLMQFDKTLDEKKTRHDKLTDMVERRKQALAVQRAKEEYQQKTLDFNAAKEAQDVLESQRGYDRGIKESDRTYKRLDDETTRKAKAEDLETQNFKDAGKAILAWEKEHGKDAPRSEVRKIGNLYQVKDWTKLAGDKPATKSSARSTREYKVAEYKAWLPKGYRQLENLIQEFEQAKGQTVNRSQLRVSMQGMMKGIEKVPDESGKRTMLYRIDSQIKKLTVKLDERNAAIQAFEGSASDYVPGVRNAAETDEDLQGQLDGLNSIIESWNSADSTGAP